mmetsp:Transcript_5052/g.14058  ORF Transcript_5052/g.14058 Transcript_5052/m.14058 type:complete len:272 (+) Transcript_5052:1128-1943(+)
MLVPPKLRTAVVILEKSAPPPGAVSSWKFGWNSGLPPGTSTSSFLNFLAVSTSPYSRSEPPLAVIRYVSPSISKASMALGERSVLNSGTCFSWHALSRTVSSPCVPPLAPQSCRPSGVRRSAVAVATSTVRMAELICSAAKSLEPSGAHASASGSSMVAGVYLRRASAKLTMSIFLFEKSSKYTIAFSGSGMCTPSACSALSLDPATLPRDTVFEDRVATSTRETDPSGSMSWQTTPPVHCPLPWLETATVLQSGEGSRLSGPGPTPTSQT